MQPKRWILSKNRKNAEKTRKLAKSEKKTENSESCYSCQFAVILLVFNPKIEKKPQNCIKNETSRPKDRKWNIRLLLIFHFLPFEMCFPMQHLTLNSMVSLVFQLD